MTSARFSSAVFLLAAATSLAAQAPCYPPEHLKAELQGKVTAAALNDLGIWFGDHKQYECATSAFAESLQTEPNQKEAPHIAFMFGVSLDLSGDVKEAIPALQEAEQLGYRDIKLHVILAQALDGTHATKDAAAEWREALEFDPEMTSAIEALSNDLLADKDYSGAITLLETPRLLGQRTPQQALNLAAAYMATSKPEEAVRVLRDGLNTAPDSLPLAHRLAELLVQLHRNDEAIALLQLTLAKHADDSDDKAMLEKLQAAPGTAK